MTQSWPMRYKQMIWVRPWEKFLKGIDLTFIFSLSPSSSCGGEKELHFRRQAGKENGLGGPWTPESSFTALSSLDFLDFLLPCKGIGWGGRGRGKGTYPKQTLVGFSVVCR